MNNWLKYAVNPGRKTANIRYDLSKRTVSIQARDTDELKKALAFVKNNPLPWGNRQYVPTMEDDYGVDDMISMDHREPPFPGEQ